MRSGSPPAGGRQSTCTAVGALGEQAVVERLDADGDRRERRRDGAGGTAAAGSSGSHCATCSHAAASASSSERQTSAPASVSRAACSLDVLRVAARALQQRHHGERAPLASSALARRLHGRAEHGGRIGVGAVAEHDVEQQQADLGIGRLHCEALGERLRVEHRVRLAGGELVGTHVDNAMGAAAEWILEMLLGAQRDVAVERVAEQLQPGDELHRQRAAAAQRAHVAARRRRAVGAGGAAGRSMTGSESVEPPSSERAAADREAAVPGVDGSRSSAVPLPKSGELASSCRASECASSAASAGEAANQTLPTRRAGIGTPSSHATSGLPSARASASSRPATAGAGGLLTSTMTRVAGSAASSCRACVAAIPPTSAERSRPPVPSACVTPVPSASRCARTACRPVPEAATTPIGPGRTRLAKPRPVPATTAVPQSGPSTSRPRCRAARLSATSSASGTWSLKRKTWRPAPSALHATSAA